MPRVFKSLWHPPNAKSQNFIKYEIQTTHHLMYDAASSPHRTFPLPLFVSSMLSLWSQSFLLHYCPHKLVLSHLEENFLLLYNLVEMANTKLNNHEKIKIGECGAIFRFFYLSPVHSFFFICHLSILVDIPSLKQRRCCLSRRSGIYNVATFIYDM